MSRIKVQVSSISTNGRIWEILKYEKRDDGWYVDSGDGLEKFASPNAQERDVQQLIRKEHDVRY